MCVCVCEQHCFVGKRRRLRRRRRVSAQRRRATRKNGTARATPTATQITQKTNRNKLTRRQALLELVGLVGVGDAERVQVAAAAHLELGHARRLLDLDRPRVLAARGDQELLDLVDLLRLFLFVCLCFGGVAAERVSGARGAVRWFEGAFPGWRRALQRRVMDCTKIETS